MIVKVNTDVAQAKLINHIHDEEQIMKKYLFLPFLLLISTSVFADVAPAKIPGASTIDAQMAKILLDKGIVFIDARDAAHFNEAHIPGAKNLNVKGEEFTPENLSALAKKDQPVVFYCTGKACMASTIATQKAIEWGWSTVYYFRGGITQWKTSGLPVE
ncbi:MAG: rhodanese-like domain-containing protein [Gammaproteobacteria bacterium]